MLPLIKSDVAFKSIISVIKWRFNTRKNVDTYTYYFCYSIWIHSLIQFGSFSVAYLLRTHTNLLFVPSLF